MASTTVQKLSLFALIGMVVGSMVGSGIFSLPRTFAHCDWTVWRDRRLDHCRGRHVHAGARVPAAGRAQARASTPVSMPMPRQGLATTPEFPVGARLLDR